MMNRTLWNLMFSWQTRVGLVVVAWLILTVVFISIRLRNKQPQYRQAMDRRRRLTDEYFKLFGKSSPRLKQVKQALKRLDHYQPKSLLTHSQEVALGLVSLMCLLLAIGSNFGGNWMAQKFTVDGFDSKYAVQETVPVTRYILYRHGHRVNSIFRADHARLKTIDGQNVYMRVDNHDRHQIVNVEKSDKNTQSVGYRMNLTQTYPKKQYAGYAGSHTERVLDVED